MELGKTQGMGPIPPTQLLVQPVPPGAEAGQTLVTLCLLCTGMNDGAMEGEAEVETHVRSVWRQRMRIRPGGGGGGRGGKCRGTVTT